MRMVTLSDFDDYGSNLPSDCWPEHDPGEPCFRLGGESMDPRRRLFTATLRFERPDGEVSVFHACHATGRADVLETLGSRIPTTYLAVVEIREGIDRNDPTVINLVPRAIVDLLADLGDCSLGHGPLASGGVIHIVEHIERDPPEACW